jgi:hypothetical protein
MTYLSVFIAALALMLFGSIGFAGFAVWVVVDALAIILIAAVVARFLPDR